MIRACYIAFVATLFVAVTATATDIYSPRQFQFYSVPNWMPLTVAATNTPGSDSISNAATTNVNKRIIDTSMKAAVDRSLEAACEREYFFQLSSREGSHNLGTTLLTLNDRRITNRAIDEYDELIGDFDHEAQYYADGAIGVLQRYQWDNWKAYESSSLSDKYQYVLKNNYISTSVFDDIYGAPFPESDIDWTAEGLGVLSNRFAVLYGIPWVGEPYESGCMYAGAMMVNPLDENDPPIAEVPHTVNFCDILDRKFSTSYGSFFYDDGSRVLNLRTPAVINQVSSVLDRSINIVNIDTSSKRVDDHYEYRIGLKSPNYTLAELGYEYENGALKLRNDAYFSFDVYTNHFEHTVSTNQVDGFSDWYDVDPSGVTAKCGISLMKSSAFSSISPNEMMSQIRGHSLPTGLYRAECRSIMWQIPSYSVKFYVNTNGNYEQFASVSKYYSENILTSKLGASISARHSFSTSQLLPRDYAEFDFSPHRQAFQAPLRATVNDFCCARIYTDGFTPPGGGVDLWHLHRENRTHFRAHDTSASHWHDHRNKMVEIVVGKTGYTFDPNGWVTFGVDKLSPMTSGCKMNKGSYQVDLHSSGTLEMYVEKMSDGTYTNAVIKNDSGITWSASLDRTIPQSHLIQEHDGCNTRCKQTISNYVEWDWASDRIYHEQQ